MKLSAVWFVHGHPRADVSLLKRVEPRREVKSLDDPAALVSHWTDRLPCWTEFAVLVTGIVALDLILVLLAR